MILEIITPNGKVFESEIKSVTAPGLAGQFQVLNNHADLLAGLDVGAIKIVKLDGTELFTCNGGVCEVNHNKVSILTESSENAKNIDKARAEKSKLRAEDRLANRTRDLDYERAKLALQRAVNRMKI